MTLNESHNHSAGEDSRGHTCPGCREARRGGACREGLGERQPVCLPDPDDGDSPSVVVRRCGWAAVTPTAPSTSPSQDRPGHECEDTLPAEPPTPSPTCSPNPPRGARELVSRVTGAGQPATLLEQGLPGLTPRDTSRTPVLGKLVSQVPSRARCKAELQALRGRVGEGGHSLQNTLSHLTNSVIFTLHRPLLVPWKRNGS